MESFIFGGLVVISLLLTIQAAHTLYLMIYTWDQPDVDGRTKAPDHFAAPALSFTALLPARHEQEVIARTIDRIVHSNYPSHLLQVLVICSADDTGTIARVREKLEDLRYEGINNADLVVFDAQPVN